MKPDEAKSRGTDPLFRFWAGRDFMFCDGWRLIFALLPMPSLMTRPNDEGRMILTAFEIEVGLRRSRQRWIDLREGFWRPYISVRSDADEIAMRRAGLA